MEGSPAKKQKQTTPMAITPPPLKRSYAAVVRNNINSNNSNDFSKKIKENGKIGLPAFEKRPIIVEAGLSSSGGQNKKCCKDALHRNEDVHPYLCQLEQALELETKYRVAAGDNPGGEMLGGITSGMRDGSAHVLRCLKVWYDLPSDVFFNAISSIDRFLAKMKAQPKHLSCIAVAAFHLACMQHQKLQQEQGKDNLIVVPEPLDLVNISQSRCSPSDLLRMRAILASKLEMNPGVGPEQPWLTKN